jgi:hypothetical protein
MVVIFMAISSQKEAGTYREAPTTLAARPPGRKHKPSGPSVAAS